MSAYDLWWLAAALSGLLVLEILRRWWRSSWARRRARRRSRLAGRAERGAKRLLERAGFTVEAVQPATTWTILVDGRPQKVDLRADYLVRDGSGRYVAEVKSGARAPSIDTAATRRQLLEYRLAYQVDGVLLVDMRDRRIVEVSFPLTSAYMGASR